MEGRPGWSKGISGGPKAVYHPAPVGRLFRGIFSPTPPNVCIMPRPEAMMSRTLSLLSLIALLAPRIAAAQPAEGMTEPGTSPTPVPTTVEDAPPPPEQADEQLTSAPD